MEDIYEFPRKHHRSLGRRGQKQWPNKSAFAPTNSTRHTGGKTATTWKIGCAPKPRPRSKSRRLDLDAPTFRLAQCEPIAGKRGATERVRSAQLQRCSLCHAEVMHPMEGYLLEHHLSDDTGRGLVQIIVCPQQMLKRGTKTWPIRVRSRN
jgi:hypothetical protein